MGVGGAEEGHVGAVGDGLDEGGHDAEGWCHGIIARKRIE